MSEVPLRGRERERERLDELLRDLRDGHGRALVLRGEAGAGKTALLDYLAGRASLDRVVRTVAVEPEAGIAYAALQQLCAPLMGHLGTLAEPERDALATAFGLRGGEMPGVAAAGAAVLGLLGAAAEREPVIWVVDDAQWLDEMSREIITFVAHRLGARPVGLVLARRGPGEGTLPELRVGGLAAADARALLDSAMSGPVDSRVRDRIVAEARGNPLALREWSRGMSPAELAFGLAAAVPQPPRPDPAAARDMYLWTLGAAVETGGGDLRKAAEAARTVPPGEDAAGLLLAGLTTWILDGYAAAAPRLRRALHALDGDDELRLLWLAVPLAQAVFDDESWWRITGRAVARARHGDTPLLPAALSLRAGAVLTAGRLSEAAELCAEARSLGEAPGLTRHASARLTLAAVRGRRAEGPAPAGAARYAEALLLNSLGDHRAALRAARQAAAHDDLTAGTFALAELVEAAARSGETAAASEARDRLAERTGPAGTGWASAVQAVADALAGPPGRAGERYREAIELLPADRLGLPLARTRLLHGEWLRRRDRPRDALVELRAAHAAFTAMGADGFAGRAGRELAAL